MSLNVSVQKEMRNHVLFAIQSFEITEACSEMRTELLRFKRIVRMGM